MKRISLNTREIAKIPGILIIEIGGELDQVQLPEVEEKVRSILLDSIHKKIVVDLLGLEYFNSSGLGIFIEGVVKSIGTDKRISFVVNKEAYIYEVFQITGATKIMNIYSTVAEAVNSLRD